MKAEEFKTMTPEELTLAERNTTERLWQLRFQHHTGQLSNTAILRATRRDLARIRTVLNERKLDISSPPGGE